MIQPNELRLFNYIKVSESTPVYSQVYAIDERFVVVDTHAKEIDLAICYPIKLTDKWLFNFGFTQNLTEDNALSVWPWHSWTLDKFSLTEPVFSRGGNWNSLKEGDFSFPTVFGPVRFVHQLQNIHSVVIGHELTLKINL